MCAFGGNSSLHFSYQFQFHYVSKGLKMVSVERKAAGLVYCAEGIDDAVVFTGKRILNFWI